MTEAEEVIERSRIELPEYPWLEPVRRRLLAQGVERLPHALLLHGQPGLGKVALALRLARDLLCLQPAGRGGSAAWGACAECHSCLLFAAGTHPDWLWVSPAEEGKPITVDQIRAVTEFLGMRPHTAARQVVLIAPAEAMNVNAANSLLKVLEEPTPGSYFLLVSHQPSRLPPTVRSRCQPVAMLPPAAEEVLSWLAKEIGSGAAQASEWLAMAEGSPLTALEYAREGLGSRRLALLEDLEALAAGRADPVATATRWSSLPVLRLLDWIYLAVAERIRRLMQEAGDDEKNIFIVNSLNNFLDVISDTKRYFPGPLDATLALENLFIEWSRIHVRRG